MNKIYRLIWNALTQTWVAVAEVANGRGKGDRRSSVLNSGHPPAASCSFHLTALAFCLVPILNLPSWAQTLPANALPTGGNVTAGSASISQSANVLTVNQASQRAALDWQSFNIGTAATVNFVQPNASAVALNRITGNSVSEIYGKLNANGQVFFSNPAGMLFAKDAQINVGSLLATTLNISNTDAFVNGDTNTLNLTGGAGSTGSIRNEGLIKATGSVALVGNTVQNSGEIIATTASLAAGNTVALDLTGDGLIRVRVTDPSLQASLENSGNITASQAVTMTAGQARAAINSVVNNTGVIRATGLVNRGGEIYLEGGRTLNSGSLDASSSTGRGGKVQMLGQEVGITGTGSLNASGATGGGEILVGGDYQGKNPEIQNASFSYVGADTSLNASAVHSGDGGKVIVWADNTTRAYGSITATGGVNGGNGGLVETSGKNALDVAGARINASAPLGKNGRWLLDPTDVTIVHGNASALTGGLFDPFSNSSIGDNQINAALAGGTDVTIQTNAGVGSNFGSIVVNGSSDSGGAVAISNNGGGPRNLSLITAGTINIKSGATLTGGSGNDLLNVNLNAANGIAIAGTIDNKGGFTTVSTGYGIPITLNGTIRNGTLTYGSGDPFNLASSNGTLDGVTLGSNLNLSGSSTFIKNSLLLTDGVTLSLGSNSNLYWSTLNANQQLAVAGGSGSATVNVAGGYAIYAGYGGTGQTVTIGSGITLQGFGGITRSSTASVINNGTIRANTADQTFTIDPTNFNNTGTVNVTAGSLRIGGGGSDTGTYSVASGTSIDFYSGTRNLNAGSDIVGAGSAIVSGSTVNVSGALGIASTGAAFSISSGTLNVNTASGVSFSNLAMSGGTLGGSGAVTVTGAFDVTNSANLSGTGSFTTSGTSTISMPTVGGGYLGVSGGKTWNNNGTFNITGDDYVYFGVSSGGTNTLNNAAGAVINLSGSSANPLKNYTGTNTINNAGTLNQTVVGSHLIDTTFNNTGTVNVTAGSLRIGGGGSDTGTYSVASGTSIDFYSGTRSLGEGSDIVGAGSAIVSGSTVNVSGALGIASTGAAFSISSGALNVNTASGVSFSNLAMSGGTLGGSGAVTVTGAFDVTGYANLNGTGSFTTSGTSTISMPTVGGGYLGLSGGKTWTNKGTLNIAGDDRILMGYGSGGTNVLLNDVGAVLNLSSTNAQPIYNYTGTNTLSNAGTLNQTVAGSHLIDTTFNNTGTVNVTAGSLRIGGGGSDTGTYSVASGTSVDFYSGTRNLNAGSDIVGAGSAIVSGSTVNVNTASGVSFSNLAMSGGTLGGSGAVTVTGAFDVTNSANLSGTGSFTTSGTSTISMPTEGGGYLGLSGGKTWTNKGTLNIAGDDRILMGYGSGGTNVLLNDVGAVLNLSSTNAQPIYNYTGTNTLSNAGTLNQTVAGSHAISNGMAFNNTGTVNVTAGSLRIGGGGSDTGTYSVASGTSVDFYSGTRNLNAGSDIVGAGSAIVSGSTVNVSGALGIASTGAAFSISSGALNVNTASGVSFSNLAMSGGTLGGSGAVTVTGAFDVTGYANLNGTGSFTTSGTSTISMPTEGGGYLGLSGGKTWTNKGTLNIAGDDRILMGYGSGGTNVLLNDVGAVLNLSSTNAQPIYNYTGTNTLSNAGTLNQTVAGSHLIDTTFNNTGTVNVTAGSLRIGGGGSDTGTYSVASGTSVDFYSGTRSLGAGSNIVGAGSAIVSGSTVNVNTASGVSFSNLAMSGGTLGGSGAVTVTGAFDVTGYANLNGTGSFTTSGTSTISMPTVGGGYLGLSGGKTWTNKGTLNIAGDDRILMGYVSGGTNVLLNDVGAVLNLSSTNAEPITNYTGTNTINNAGTLNQTVAGSHAINATNFTNNGTVRVTAGTMNVNAANFNHSASGVIDVSSGASFQRTAGFTNLGTIRGSGQVVVGTGASKLVNQGTISPGGAAVVGTLTITGDVQAGAGSVLELDLGGTGAGQSDKLVVSGAMTGTFDSLTASVMNGYSPANADYIPVFTAGSTSGLGFTNTSLPLGFSAGLNLAAGEAVRLIYAAGAGTKTFTNAAGGLDWSVAGNWSSGSLPGAGDTALLSAGYAVTHSSGTDTIAALTINTANALDVSGGSLTVTGATTLGGTLTVSGSGSATLNGALNGADTGQVNVSGGTFTANGAVAVNVFNMTGGQMSQVGSVLPSFSATDFRLTGGNFVRALGGDGTEGSPYQLTDIHGLQGMRTDAMLGKAYTLANNIDASGTWAWNSGLGFNPIGGTDSPFTGRLNGQSYSISGLVINRPTESNVGLFGTTSAAASVANVNLSGGAITGDSRVGAVVGDNSGQVNAMNSTASVSGQSFLGGLVGFNQSTASLADSSASASVIGAGGSYAVGGLVGWNSGTVSNSVFSGSVTGSSSVGGIVGTPDIYSGSISNSHYNIDSVSINGLNGVYVTRGGLFNTQYQQWINQGKSLSIQNYQQSLPFDVASNTYGIFSVQSLKDLLGFADQGYNFKLTSNIDLSGNANLHIPYLNGSLDGNAKTVSYLNIDQSFSNQVGLVGRFAGSEIKNLILNDARVTGRINVGALAGINLGGTIDGVQVQGNNSQTGVTGTDYTGGLVGFNFGTSGAYGTVIDSSSTINVSASGINVGGFVGNNYGTISNSYATGAVTGWRYVGGLVGQNTGDISNSYASGAVSGTESVGGLLGVNFSGTISNSHASGAVTSTGDFVGGLVGANFGNNNVENNVSSLVEATSFVGLSNFTISNSYATGNVSGNSNVGGLVGQNGGSISRSHASGTVTSTGDNVGGLVGANFNAISHSYAIGDVSGSINVGGLVGLSSYAGFSDLTISNTYATGNVSGTTNVGGLVGKVTSGNPLGLKSIENSYATGNVSANRYGGGLVGYNSGSISTSYADATITGTGSDASELGGLVGFNSPGGDGDSPGTVTSSYWNSSKYANSAGGTGLSETQMKQSGSFVGWDLAKTGGSNAVWRVYEGNTTPLLRSFLSTLTLANAPDRTLTYNATAQSAGTTLGPFVLGAAATGTNAGFYNGYYSTQQGYDLIGGNLTIDPASLTIINLSGSRVYDGTNIVNANIFSLSGLLGGQSLSLTGQGTVADKNLGVDKPVSLGTLALGNGNNGLAANYTLVGGTHKATITPASVTLSTNNVSKTYDGSTSAAGTAVVTAGTLFGSDSLSGGSFAFTDKNAGSNKTVAVSAVNIDDGNDGANYSVSYASNTASTITQLASVAWTGAGNDNKWSTAANWAGGAIPDFANVAAVSIPANATVNFDSQELSATLSSLSSQGRLNVSNGLLTVGSLSANGTLNTSILRATGGKLVVYGSLSAADYDASNNSVNFNYNSQNPYSSRLTDLSLGFAGDANLSAAIVASNSISLTAAGRIVQGGEFSGTALSAPRIELAAGTGIGQAQSRLQLATNSLSASTTSGPLQLHNTPSSAVTMSLMRNTSADATYYSQDGNALNIVGNITSSGGAITIDPPSSITMSANSNINSGGGDIDLQATGDMSLTSVNAGGAAVKIQTPGRVVASMPIAKVSFTGGGSFVNGPSSETSTSTSTEAAIAVAVTTVLAGNSSSSLSPSVLSSSTANTPSTGTTSASQSDPSGLITLVVAGNSISRPAQDLVTPSKSRGRQLMCRRS